MLTPELVEGVAEFVAACQTFEGGIGGEAAVNITQEGEDVTPSKARFPALAFDLKDARGEVKVYADVALDAAELVDAIGNMPEGLDASALCTAQLAVRSRRHVNQRAPIVRFHSAWALLQPEANTWLRVVRSGSRTRAS